MTANPSFALANAGAADESLRIVHSTQSLFLAVLVFTLAN
jgi:hypothetical protein